MIRRPPRSTPIKSSAASDVYKRQFFVFSQKKRKMQKNNQYLLSPLPPAHKLPGRSDPARSAPNSPMLKKSQSLPPAPVMKTDSKMKRTLTEKSITPSRKMWNSIPTESTQPQPRRKFQTLPDFWTAVRTTEGEVYYWNQETDETTWDFPMDYLDEVEYHSGRKLAPLESPLGPVVSANGDIALSGQHSDATHNSIGLPQNVVRF
eukprot:TRINITY_DN625_c0_g1_i1.p1 TRINITY_DN625_c0_g1~~TRINITY_DN625_c0_g1_i1.p1  ORF type:complete len:205 (-),score=46.49 TRINITY_DN625_c0_g1_i1:171-785(-)